jgi:hypothetical protein
VLLKKLQSLLHFFTQNVKNDPKTNSFKDNTKFCSAFSMTMLSYATGFGRKRGVLESFEYLGEFEEDF